MERRCLWEEGLLRVGGNKQRVETLCSRLEAQFYPRLELCDHLISTASPHDLTNVLKRLLRELPQPLLTTRFLNTFYQTHGKYMVKTSSRFTVLNTYSNLWLSLMRSYA